MSDNLSDLSHFDVPKVELSGQPIHEGVFLSTIETKNYDDDDYCASQN